LRLRRAAWMQAGAKVLAAAPDPVGAPPAEGRFLRPEFFTQIQ